MTNKPSYEELEQRVRVLEKEAVSRKRAEEALGESEELYRATIEHLNDGIAIIKGDDHIYVNEKFVEIFGYDIPEDILERPVSAFVHPDDRERMIEFNRQRKERMSGPATYEFKGIRQDGEPVYLSVSSTSTVYRGEPVYLVFLRDITERKRAEEALQESEAQKRAILDASLDRIRYVDKDMRIIWANKTTSMQPDMSPDDLVGRVCYEVFFGREDPCKGCPTVRARETGQIERAIIHHLEANGVERESYWDNYSVPLKNEAGEIEGFIQIARNITAQMRAEERIHTLSQELIRAQESERRMISRELHDRVGQDLSTLKIGCETLFDDHQTTPFEIRRKASELSKSLDVVISTVRDMAYDLRPPSLDQLGLVQTVFEYCDDFSKKTGLSIDFFSAGMDDLRLDFDTEINLYRLIQEGLNNIKKHADASRVIIRLVASFPKIILRIEDNGKGFDVEGRLLRASKEKRMGLGSMEERVSLLNGNLRIQSRLMEGTKILVEIPYKE